MAVSIRAGDALACLRAMPADSVHCCVTSPPYWGLRDYGTPPQIWGDDPDCRHRWGADIGVLTSHPQQSRNGRGVLGDRARHPSAARTSFKASQGVFCARCGAWRGSLGLEPDYRLYVDHLVAVMREVRRVLRAGGTLWLNLGDCYATGAGKAKRAGGCDGPSGGWEEKGVPTTQPNRMPQPGLKPKDLAGIPWRVAFALQDDGWWLRRDHVWAKPNPMPESVRDRCTTAHEYLFLLTKSARYYYDADAIKEPAVSDHGAGNSMSRYNAERIANSPLTGGPGSQKPWSDIGGKRNKRSVWTVATAPFPGAHFATFPPALIEPCILAGCPAGGTVLDPFLGAGTTALVADRLGRHSIGVELSPAYAAMARDRIGGPKLARAAA